MYGRNSFISLNLGTRNLDTLLNKVPLIVIHVFIVTTGNPSNNKILIDSRYQSIKRLNLLDCRVPHYPAKVSGALPRGLQDLHTKA